MYKVSKSKALSYSNKVLVKSGFAERMGYNECILLLFFNTEVQLNLFALDTVQLIGGAALGRWTDVRASELDEDNL